MRKNFTYQDGTERKPLPTALVSVAVAIYSLMGKVGKTSAELENLYRSIALHIVNMRCGYANPGGQSVKLRDASIKLAPSAIDYAGRSKDAHKAEEQVWSAVIDASLFEDWKMATGKAASDYPIRKSVAYHIERVIKERFADDNPTLSTVVAEDAPEGTLSELAEAFEKVTGMQHPARGSAGRGAGKGKNTERPVLNPTKPVQCVQDMAATCGRIKRTELDAAIAKLTAADKRKFVNALQQLSNFVTITVTEHAKPKAAKAA